MYAAFEFFLAGGGGNVVGTLLKVFEKLSYVEMRIQYLGGHTRDTKRRFSGSFLKLNSFPMASHGAKSPSPSFFKRCIYVRIYAYIENARI